MEEYKIFTLGMSLGAFLVLSLFHHPIWMIAYLIVAFYSFIVLVRFDLVYVKKESGVEEK